MIEARQRTLEEWYERSPVDTSTFDAESRRQIQEVVDGSEDVYESNGDICEFFEQAVEAFGGEFEKRGTNPYQAELPDGISSPGQDATFGPFTFDRDFAMDYGDITYSLPTRMSCNGSWPVCWKTSAVKSDSNSVRSSTRRGSPTTIAWRSRTVLAT